MENKDVGAFRGFSYPDDIGFTRLPNDWFSVCAEVNNIAELKVILYVARHTWGYQDYDKWRRLSIDEFMYGRFASDDTRMDDGTGLSEMSVRHGLKKAIDHGYLLSKTNKRDLARITKYYKLKMRVLE